MNLIIISIILILTKGEASNSDNACRDVTGPNGENVDLKKECKPGSPSCLVKCCGPNEVISKLPNNTEPCHSTDVVIKQYPEFIAIKEEMNSLSGLHIFTDNGNVSTKKFMDFHILYRKHFALRDNCTVPYAEKDVTIKENGVAEFIVGDKDGLISNSNKTITAPDFCVEMLAINLNSTLTTYYGVFIVGEPNNTQEEDMFIAYGGLVSAFFIVLLLLIYGLLKQLHNNLHGMLLMSFMGSLMMFELFLSGTTIYEIKYRGNSETEIEALKSVCEWLSPLAYFFLLSAFFWMNIMSFDIWWTFRGTRKVREIHRRGIYVKYLIYSVYAWGLPIIITIIAVVIDKANLPPDIVSRPGFELCQKDYGLNLGRMYKFFPMLVLVMANIVLYIMTIYNIWAVQTSVKGFDKDNKQNKRNQNQFIIYIKLSVIMGVNWLTEVAQAFIGKDHMKTWLFYTLNIFNVYIGVFVFIIMVFKRSVFIMLCKRFNMENRWIGRSTNSKSTTRTNRSKASIVTNTKSTDDSIQIKSCVYSTDDTSKIEEQNQLLNPRFIETRM